MKLPRLAIDNHQFTLMIFLLFLIMGVTAIFTMPRTEDPPMDIPGASIVVVYPGGNPVDLEELIVTPIEEALNELEDIKVINSSMKDGIVSIGIEFNFETDPDDKFNEVLRQVNSVRSDLPGDIYDLQVLEWSSTDVVMKQLAFVSAGASYRRIRDRAENLKKEIERLNGVRMAEIFACPGQQVKVALDPGKMAAMGISASQVAGALKSNNANIPGGELTIGEKTFNVKTSGTFTNISDISGIVVSSYRGSLVHLRDIAGVSFAYEDVNYRASVNGTRAVFLTVKQKENLNIFRISKELDPVIDRFSERLDPDIRLVTVFDQTESVDRRINGFFSNLLQGIVLVGIVIFLSLGFRASLLVIIAIPLSIVIGLGWVDLANYGLQQISIAALVIALGLLVDNSIVITENIGRFIRQGRDRKDAAAEGASQLAWPVISATVTTMFAFIPIIMMPDKAGRFIQSLPVTVIFTLFASLLIALTLTPYLASRFLKGGSRPVARRGFRSLLSRFIEGPYHRSLRLALRRPWLVISLAVLALGGAAWLFTLVGVSFFPKAEKPQFMIRVNMPEGSSLEKTGEVTKYVGSVLDTMDIVKVYASNVGHGNPRIYYNIFPRQFEKNYAEIFVELKRYQVDEFDALIRRLRDFFSGYPGARIQLKEFEQGTPIEAPLTIKITGDKLDELKRISADVLQKVRGIPGVVNSDNNLSKVTTELWFNINRDKAGLFGVPVSQTDLTIRTAIAGTKTGSFRDTKGRDFDIVMRLPEGEDITVEDLGKIYVPSLTGKMIPLSQLARIEFRDAPGVISHYNLMRDATVTADIEKGYRLDDVIAQLRPFLDNYHWPPGYSYKFTGELESREESFGGLFRAGIIALIGIFSVLVLQFRSFRQPFIIFSAIPLAVIGSVLALYFTGNTFSFTAFIGFVSLTGIVVNNSIIMVDYSNILRRQGKNMKDALTEAGETRFTPIILTTLTTIGGLLPLTLRGGTLWAPMGWTIIGGLLVSTFLTLLVVPVLYMLIERKEVEVEPNVV